MIVDEGTMRELERKVNVEENIVLLYLEGVSTIKLLSFREIPILGFYSLVLAAQEQKSC